MTETAIETDCKNIKVYKRKKHISNRVEIR